MLLTFPPGPIMLDGEELCHNAKLFLKPETLQGRLTFFDPNGNPVDIIVQGCSKPKMKDMGTAVIDPIYGLEEHTKIPFKLRLEFKVFKEIFKLEGMIGSTKISLQDKSLITIILETIKHTSQIIKGGK